MKKIIFTVISLCILLALTACRQPEIISYHIDENGKLIATYGDSTTADLGTLTDTIANGANAITINDNGYYVINGIISKIKANLPKSYEIDSDGNLIVTYTDTTTENLGKFGNDAINTIDTISVSDDGFYILNGIKTDILAVDVYEVEFITGYSATVKTQVVKDGKKVERPQLERDGYTLVGWYCNGEEWRFNSDVVLNEMTLTAEWVANDYFVNFDTGINKTLPEQIIAFDSEYTLPTLARDGYTFKGWEYNGTSVNADKWNISENCTLIAKWEVNTYTITLNANGGNVSKNTIDVTYGRDFQLPIPTNEFGIFRGWYYGDVKITDENGKSLAKWAYVENIEVSTFWITEIHGVADLLNIRNALNGHYVLMADIDLSNTEWIPLGALEGLGDLTSDHFTGVIDGNGHTISGLTITHYFAALNAYGLVSYNFGTIKNLKLTNVTISLTGITNDAYAGAICGYNRGTIDNCVVEGTISISNHSGSHNSYAGGIAGASASTSLNNNVNFNPNINNCINNASVTASKYAGGIAGLDMESYEFSNCQNNGNVYSNNIAGGIVGFSYGNRFNQCKNTGMITGDKSAGGILGSTQDSSLLDTRDTSFTLCANTGNIKASNSSSCYAGGIAGFVYTASISDCYNIGEIKGNYAGGILGCSYFYGTSIQNTYNNGKISGSLWAAGIFAYGADVDIQNSVNFGAISSNTAKGFICAALYSGTLSNCYYVSASGTYSDATAPGVSATSYSIKDFSFFKDTLYWSVISSVNGDGIWFVDGTTYPKLKWEIL